MKSFMRSVACAAMIAITAPVIAADEEEEDTDGWDGKVSLGYLASEGNSESTSATAEFEATWRKNKWSHGANGRFFSSSAEQADGSTNQTAENYLLGWKSTFSFTDNNYAFGKAEWIKNRFSGYPRQMFLTGGYGRRIINNETIQFDGEIGAGYADQKAINDAPPPEKVDEDGAVVTGALDFRWIWTDTSDFSQVLKANYTEANTFWQSITRIRAKINATLSLGISYTVQGNTDVAPGVENTDRFTAITLDYNF